MTDEGLIKAAAVLGVAAVVVTALVCHATWMFWLLIILGVVIFA